MVQLEANESIVLEVRRHWYVIAVKGALFTLLIPLPFLALGNVQVFASAPSAAGQAGLFIFVGAAWLLLLWIAFFISWTNYYLDVWLITTKRVMSIEQTGLFRRTVSAFRRERIQDVTVSVNGIMAHLFNFGDVSVQTASESKPFVIHEAPRPYAVQNALAGRGEEGTASAANV